MATSGKLPGKTAYSGIRRPVTRSAGVTSHATATGGEWDCHNSSHVTISAGEELRFEFEIPAHAPGQWIAFGGWYRAENDVEVWLDSPFPKFTLTAPSEANWSKFGSMWVGNGAACKAVFYAKAKRDTILSIWEFGCGIARNPGCHSGDDYIECDSDSYLKKMYDLSPEGHFWLEEGNFEIIGNNSKDRLLPTGGQEIFRKSCNRCGRFLPINIENERATLSFSNHCIAKHPCKHSTFGKSRHVDSGDVKKFEYGFQLECRFCKKYCVNWLHNHQRTAAQMKEDGARRRFFELLIAELFQESKQLAYRSKPGRELTDYIWEKFERKCFNCEEPLSSAKSMHLDHTRPLALLWPLDESATALCGPCNSSKSDKFPSEFYELPGALDKLSTITGISLADLESPTPNMLVVSELMSKLDWFFSDFLTRPEMIKERDGKVAAELVVKALQKTLDRCPGGAPIDLKLEYEKRLAAQNINDRPR